VNITKQRTKTFAHLTV